MTLGKNLGSLLVQMFSLSINKDEKNRFNKGRS